MAQHSRYWSCSALADWLRGTKKPGAATSEKWDEWYALAEAAYPIRYWIAEEGLDKAQDFVTWPARKVSDVRTYLTNRYVSKTHVLSTTLKKGKYYEYETRLLHGMFDSLVDYVEIEEAWIQVAWSDDGKEKYKSTHRFWWNEWRCPQAGVDRLTWQAALVLDKDMGVDETSPDYGKPTNQAETAQEILALYTWWKIERPARPDPWVASGWTAFNEARNATNDLTTKSSRRKARFKRSKAEQTESSRLFAIMNKIEAKYEREDEQMMIRLVRVRKSMWT